jgi:hypothetical protein
MIEFISAKLHIAPEKMGDLPAILERYAVNVSGGNVKVNGTLLPLTPFSDTNIAAAVHIDDVETSRFRVAVVDGVSINPAPIYPERENITESNPVGYLISCCWNKALLDDINLDPKPEWLAGVELVTEP